MGVAAFDMYLGEAFCGTLPGFCDLLPEILDYAEAGLADENGLGVAVGDGDTATKALFLQRGYHPAEQRETMLRLPLDRPLTYSLQSVLTICEVKLPEDGYPYQLVLWKGFDHGNDLSEFEKTLAPQEPKHPHATPALRLAAVDPKDAFAAHCQCWFNPTTDYAYLEPVCTIPEYRGMGVGRAVVSEALNRCRELGAREAFVLSDQEFYKRLGFEPYSCHTFYRKKQMPAYSGHQE